MKRKYFQNRTIEEIKGFFVIEPQEKEKTAPFYCKCCNNLLRTKEDEESWEKFKCCEWCANNWAYKFSDKWFKGWRPSKQEINDAKKDRPKLRISFK